MQGAAAGAAGNAEFQALRGTVLQRLGRHPEAVEAYRNAVRAQPSGAQAWIGLGVSLEALERKTEAVDAFRRALATGPANAELRTFAEQRIRALQ
jgi:Flp pilus assembly protein TadD